MANPLDAASKTTESITMTMHEELSQIVYDSGMNTTEFAYAMGVSRKKLIRILQGESIGQPFLERAKEILAQLNLVQSIVDHNPKLQKIKYVVWKTILREYELDIEE